MSSLSGYDSEALGFDSITLSRRPERDSSSQTTDFSEAGVASQTNLQHERGSSARPEEPGAQDDILREYPPPGLNEFLRRVVPAVLQELDRTDNEARCDSADSDEEETPTAKAVQEIHCGGAQRALDASWSGGGTTLAVALGHAHHDACCAHEGLLRVYSLRRAGAAAGAGDAAAFVGGAQLKEASCVTAVRFHGTAAALLAYGTAAGGVAAAELGDGGATWAATLAAPASAHAAGAVTALHWADPPLAHTFLTMHIVATGKRRSAADQVLVSAGSDGAVRVWLVNVPAGRFDAVASYSPRAARGGPALHIACLAFAPAGRDAEGGLAGDAFAVGASTGELVVCEAGAGAEAAAGAALAPHRGCVLGAAFGRRRALLASASADGELRLYDVRQAAPLRVVCVAGGVSRAAWLPAGAAPAALLAGREGARLLDAGEGREGREGRELRVRGLGAAAGATALCAHRTHRAGASRVAAGGADGVLRIWELPAKAQRL